MKKFLVSIVCMVGVALLAACDTTLGSAEASAERAAAVKQALADRNFKIDVNFMYPMRGSSRNLTSEYSLEVRNDSLFSHLPFMGEARNLPYGGGVGLNFDEHISSYVQQQQKGDEYLIEIGVKNTEDVYVYTIRVFDNGRSSIDVRSRLRDPISYSGELSF